VADLVDLRGLSLERDGPDGPFPVLRDLVLRLGPGERLAVLGGNGSGKSSLLRHLATPGVLSGVRCGFVAQDPEEQLVAGTVAEEIALGRPAGDLASSLAACGLTGRGGEDPRLLAAGEKQRLQVAIVLAGEPDLLLLDEPTSLQDRDQGAWLRERLATWPGAQIWATQRPEEAALCRRVLVLDDGRTLVDGPASAVLERPEVHALVAPDYPAGAPPPPAGEVVAVLAGGGCRFAGGGGFAGVDLTLRGGDRVGVCGLNGSGKSTLLGVLAGLRRPDAGTVELAGRRLYRRGALDLDHGAAALAPQFPEYLFTQRDVAAEIGLDPRLATVDPAAFLRELGLEPALARRRPFDLSGGQQRRLARALALRARRPLVLLDEPTAALDAAGRARLARLVQALDSTTAFVVASHDEDFLDACGCRVLRLAAGGLAPVSPPCYLPRVHGPF